jgi:hypothetical protein
MGTVYKARYIGKGKIFIPEQKGMSEKIVAVGEKKFKLNQNIDIVVEASKAIKILTPENKK